MSDSPVGRSLGRSNLPNGFTAGFASGLVFHELGHSIVAKTENTKRSGMVPIGTQIMLLMHKVEIFLLQGLDGNFRVTRDKKFLLFIAGFYYLINNPSIVIFNIITFTLTNPSLHIPGPRRFSEHFCRYVLMLLLLQVRQTPSQDETLQNS